MDWNAILIIFMVVVLPVWIIFHYGSRKHQSHRLTPDDERMLEDLWRSAKEMERRIGAIEAIVEPDAPNRPAATGGFADRQG
jgi:phage shock protein B